jgi:hypothetical protein
METLTNGARRTIACLRALCGRHGVSFKDALERLCGGFTRYGADNHLSPEFRVFDEWGEEAQDMVAFAAVAVSRGDVDAEDPQLALYMDGLSQALDALRVLRSRRCTSCRGECLQCDAEVCP